MEADVEIEGCFPLCPSTPQHINAELLLFDALRLGLLCGGDGVGDDDGASIDVCMTACLHSIHNDHQSRRSKERKVKRRNEMRIGQLCENNSRARYGRGHKLIYM